MPAHKPRNKTEKKAAVKEVMGEFSNGDLHSGSKQGPKVTNPKQAVAIAMSESGQSKKSKPKSKDYDRDAHWPGNPGFPSSENAGSSPPPETYANHEKREKEVMGSGYEMHEKAEDKGWSAPAASHSFPQAKANAHGYGHSGGQRQGHLRTSGHSGAHQIGKKR